jgi:hypothetical protein
MTRMANNPHEWAPAPAGQGTLDMCRKCGWRRKPAIEAEPCDSLNIPEIPGVTSNYEPYQGD